MTLLLSQPRPAPSVPAASLRLWKPEQRPEPLSFADKWPKSKRDQWSDKELLRVAAMGLKLSDADLDRVRSLMQRENW